MALSGGIDHQARTTLTGTQTLMRGLDVLDMVAQGTITQGLLAQDLGLTRSKAQRLAAALVDRGYLLWAPRTGYSLGPKLLELGHRAQQQLDLPRIARPFIEQLATATWDTVHLGVLGGMHALYLDKVPGRRRIEIGSRVGERHPVASSLLGRALILGHTRSMWLACFNDRYGHTGDWMGWKKAMDDFVESGCTFGMEESEDHIACVAAPILGANGRVIAAIGLYSAAQYMSDERMCQLTEQVKDAARGISRSIGWRD